MAERRDGPKASPGAYSQSEVADETVGRKTRPAERPPARPSVPAPKITFTDSRREPESVPPSQLPRDVVNLEMLLTSGVNSAVREELTQPPPVPTETEDRAVHIVEELRRCSPGGEQGQLPRLLALGPEAIPVAARGFPGALSMNRQAIGGRPAPGRAVSALACALIEFGDAAVPWVSGLLEVDHPDIRFYAVLVAGDIGHDDLVLALGRLVFDDEYDVRRAALHVLRNMNDLPRFVTLRATLTSTAANAAAHGPYRLLALTGLAELRDVPSFRLFVELLGDSNVAVVDASRAALLRLCGQDLGSSAKKWVSWFKKHEEEHRAQWLIEGIVQDAQSVRTLAAEELRALTKVKLPLDATAKKGERKKQLKAWREWWMTEGQAALGA